jgi:hypothetical protein
VSEVLGGLGHGRLGGDLRVRLHGHVELEHGAGVGAVGGLAYRELRVADGLGIDDQGDLPIGIAHGVALVVPHDIGGDDAPVLSGHGDGAGRGGIQLQRHAAGIWLVLAVLLIDRLDGSGVHRCARF